MTAPLSPANEHDISGLTQPELWGQPEGVACGPVDAREYSDPYDWRIMRDFMEGWFGPKEPES